VTCAGYSCAQQAVQLQAGLGQGEEVEDISLKLEEEEVVVLDDILWVLDEEEVGVVEDIFYELEEEEVGVVEHI